MLSESSNFAGADDRPYASHEIPAVIRTKLNAEMDRDLLARMRGLARKKQMLQPDITVDDMANYLVLTQNFQDLPKPLSARRSGLQSANRATVAWVTATVIITGFLTAMLIVAIAIAV